MKNTNRLIRESSPYLLQHAHNPVDWFPWGDEAIGRAKSEDKPILLSIGYAACHWCHVMAHESFEDADTAALMNALFINIKVDREERPDLDHIYMDALQTMTGSGGWPLNIFLTPDLKPFYGGTYFPPVAAYQRPSWSEVLQSVSKAFRERREDIEQQAHQMLGFLSQSNAHGTSKPGAERSWTMHDLHDMVEVVMKSADTANGGFSRAPKFPSVSTLQFLLRYLSSRSDSKVERQFRLTLERMSQGGIYDQLGGGFSRYATDTHWQIPHFEKMLYDNAMLVSCYAEAYQWYNDPQYKRVCEQTLTFVKRELKHPDGGWYTALDADSDGVEGAYYCWNHDEVARILGDDAPWFSAYYHITESGNWEGTNILFCSEELTSFAKNNGLDPDDLEAACTRCRALLMEQRSYRTPPQTDTKRILATNALMVAAYLKAYAAFGWHAYLEEALEGLAYIREAFSASLTGGLLHQAAEGQSAAQGAFLDDYACYIDTLIQAGSITGDLTYVNEARRLTSFVIQEFGDENGVYFYFTPEGQDDVIVRKREMYDGSTPSGNALMASNLWKLSLLVGESEWRTRAWNMVHAFAETVSRYPTSFACWASVLWDMTHGTAEIALLGSKAFTAGHELLRHYLGGSVYLFADEPRADFPLLAREKPTSELMAYLCRDFECTLPVRDIAELLEQYTQFNRSGQEALPVNA